MVGDGRVRVDVNVDVCADVAKKSRNPNYPPFLVLPLVNLNNVNVAVTFHFGSRASQ